MLMPRLRRRWKSLSPGRRWAAGAAGALAAVTVLLITFIPRGGDEAPVAEAPAFPALPERPARIEIRPADVRIAGEPSIVRVNAGTVEQVVTATQDLRDSLARAAAGQILPHVEADRVIGIQLVGLPISFESFADHDRQLLESRFGADAARVYEKSVASLLATTMEAVERQRPGAVMTVLGLPVEPEETGNLRLAKQTNQRYRAVIDRLGSFVPARRFVVFGSKLDERMLARMGMKEALRLRDGRPIVFQSNMTWRAIVDSDEPGGGLEVQAVLGD